MASTHGIDGKQLVLSAVDLVDLIGRSVSLKRRGKDYVGLCPFHQEKTPSFYVRDGRYFICFGCRESGNAIDFVMKRDRVDFLTALRQLAEMYHVELPKFAGDSTRRDSRQTLFDINAAAVAVYEKLLQSDDPQARQAREYLASRGFSPEILKKFRVGFAPDAWETLLRNPAMNGFKPEQVHAAGLLKAREAGNGFYDTFRKRIIFPIRDETGRTIALGGRTLPGDDNPAKYLNSPESAVFSKSRCCFGLDLAREQIVKTRTVAVVEGYTDVMMAHQYGAANVVSSLGTALTEHHIHLLRRFADRIVLLFDADTAGENAVERAVRLFLTQPVEIAIAALPDGLDPDEFLVRNGRDAFTQLLDRAEDALGYQWRLLGNRVGSSAPGGLTASQRAVENYLDLLAAARGEGPIDPLRWGMALARVAKLIDVPIETLQNRFAGKKNASRRTSSPVAHTITAGPTTPRQPKTPARPQSADPATDDSADLVAQRWIIGILLAEPRRWESVQTRVDPSEFTPGPTAELASRIWDHNRHEGLLDLPVFAADLDDSLKPLVYQWVESVMQLGELDRTLDAALSHLVERRNRLERLKLLSDAARSDSDAAAQAAAFEAYVKKHRKTDPRRFGVAG